MRFTVLLVTAIAVLCAPLAPAHLSDESPLAHDDQVIAAIQHAERGRLEKRVAATAPDTSGYDVRKYTIDLSVDFIGHTIDSVVQIDAVSTAANLTAVDLDFSGFTVSSVQVNGSAAQFTRNGSDLRVQVGQIATPGQSFSIVVAYSGAPPIQGGLGFGFTSRGAATFAEPEGAHLWFPCKDRPSDKAGYEGLITVPSNQVVASNGELLEVTDASGGRKTFHWREDHAVATYLIVLSISNYQIIHQQAGDIPVVHYVYPEIASAAQRDFSRTPDMILGFQDRLGVPYPFDKYGHALFENFGGAMEHQTMTSYGSRLITGDNRYDRVVAHELGHHWFGDLVSPVEWEEIWLNEGFATWMEFLWTEISDPGTLAALMKGREEYYFGVEEDSGRYSLYDPGMSRLFGPTIYQKGGWVVAMLRYQIGDEAFFAGLKSYLDHNAFGNGSSVKLKEEMEAASGEDLDPFFQQWVYGVGYPTYQVSWSARAVTDGFQADVRIRQSQTGTPTFTIPLEVEVTYADGSKTLQRVEVESGDHIASLCLDAAPTSIRVDPDNKVLGTVSNTSGTVAPQPAVCGDDPTDSLAITSVAFVKNNNGGKDQLVLGGVGFRVSDTRVEVNGVELAKTKYPKPFRNPDGTASRVVGKQAGLRSLIPVGVPVQVSVVNPTSGLRSAAVTFTRTN